MSGIGGHVNRGDRARARAAAAPETLDEYLQRKLAESFDRWLDDLDLPDWQQRYARAMFDTRALQVSIVVPRRNGRTEALRIAERALRASGLDVVRWAYDPDRPRPAGASWHAPGTAIDLPAPDPRG